MVLYQQPCNSQEARDRVMVLELISREEFLTMSPERVNAILQAFNEGRTLEEAARLADEFLGMLGYIRAAFIYSTTAADDECGIERNYRSITRQQRSAPQ